MTQKISVSFRDWIWDEILDKAPNKSALIEEALIKFHISKLQEKLNKQDQESNVTSPPTFSGSNVCDTLSFINETAQDKRFRNAHI